MLRDLVKLEAPTSTIDYKGQLETGDIEYCKEGKHLIVGRRKALIKARGW